MMKNSVARLIKKFQPIHYELHITQKPAQLTFNGHVIINGVMPRPSTVITLHAHELNITSVKAQGATCSHTIQPKEQTITINLNSQHKGELTLELIFDGNITKQMHGLYPCYFTNSSRQEQLLATQFESHHAREVFPCIDEPEAKATFKLTLTSDSTDVAISNTPIESESIKDDTKTTTFEITPKMSTYLLAWVSGNLVYEEGSTKSGVKVRAFSTPIHANKTSFGLEVAIKALDYMNDYFAIPYPLPKCDIIALPDFAAGAMENWGCITFRESAMLVDPTHSDLHDKQHVAAVITHELAHQWFGNLVTMRWWDDLWLNEGFASWVPYLVLDDLFPEWNMWEEFATSDLMIGMRADALCNTHPIVVDIHDPSEIRSAFDSISYDKGCSVINLLYKAIGPVAFQEGLRYYLKKHAYGNAQTDDLWEAWSQVSGKNIQSFMQAWTKEAGFPIINADSNDGVSATLTQERFLLDPHAEKSTTVWPIPLMNGEDESVMNTKTMKSHTISKLNQGQSGFFRVCYSGEYKRYIVSLINENILSDIDILGVVNDTAEAAKAGYHSTTELIELIPNLKHSTNHNLITTALAELGSIRMVMPELYEPLKPFVADFIAPSLDRLGIDQKTTDTTDDELLRPAILAAASYSGHKTTIEWALKIFDKALNPEEIRADIRGVVYQTAVREYDDRKTYDKLLNWYQKNLIPGEQIALASALTSFSNKELINLSLSEITTKAVRLQDALYWVTYSLSGRHSRYDAWNWLKQQWGWIGDNFGQDKEIDYFLRSAAAYFATNDHLNEYSEFFDSHEIYGSKRAYEQGKETIRWQTAWRERDTNRIKDYLTTYLR